MSKAFDVLNTLFGSYEGPIKFDLNTEITETDDPDFIRDNITALRIHLQTQAGIHAVYSVTDGPAPKPATFILKKDDVRIPVFVFKEPVASLIPELLELYDFEEAMPNDGVDGWEIEGEITENFYDPEELIPAKEAAPKSGPQMYGDAVVKRPYSEADYANHMVTVSVGSNSKSMEWHPNVRPLGAVIASLSQHKIGPKDGQAIVLGDIVPGPRVKNAVKALYFIGLDIDTGVPSEVIDAALAKHPYVAIRCTTHSHGKKTSEFKKDAVLKFAGEEEGEIDTDLMRRFCAEKHNYDPSIVETVEYVDEVHSTSGIMVRVKHKEMPKNRIFMPMDKPFNIGEEGKTQLEALKKWEKVPEALANYLGLPFDSSCKDASRLFFMPRHDKGRPFSISLFGGELFDRKVLQLEDPFEQIAKEVKSKGSKSVTEAGKALGRWSVKAAHGFQIVDVLEEYCPEKIRGSASMGKTIECPFDEDHSNAGDPYDKACYTAGAAEGSNEMFFIHCRHESCQKYTSLDQLGKMIEDGWFPREVIDDQKYSIVDFESDETSDDAKKIHEQDESRASYLKAIDALDENSSAEAREEAIRLVLLSNLEATAQGHANELLRKKLKTNTGALKVAFKKVKDKLNEGAPGPAVEDEKKRRVYRYPIMGFNFHEAVDVVSKALDQQNRINRDGVIEFYPRWSQMDGVPVQLIKVPLKEQYTFKSYTDSALWSTLCKHVVFCRQMEQGEGPHTQVDKDVAKYVFNEFYDNFPPTPEIVYTPLFAKGGVLINKPGYYGGDAYPDMNLLVADTALDVGHIDDNPTADQALASLEWLRTEVLGDFPFMDSDDHGNDRREPSEANALAMLFTPFMRRMIDSCTPVFFVSKPTPGTGGTLLGRLPMVLFDGFTAAPARYSSNEEEMNKVLVSEILQARTCLFFDDVKEFNSRELLRAITSPFIGGRILGGSKTIERPNTFLWGASGNNPTILSEMERRLVHINLNARTPDVQKRTFRHNLETFLLGQTSPEVIEAERGQAVRAILTIIQYWISQGMPLFKERTLQSFEDWAAKVGGALQAVAVEGFLDNRRSAMQDIDEAAIREFVRVWLKNQGVDHMSTPSELLKMALDLTMDIIDGNSDDQKKSRFMRRLPTLEGRTFSIDGYDYMVRKGVNRDETLCFYISQIRKTKSEDGLD